MPTRAETKQYLTDSLTELFPEKGIRVFERCLIGETSLHVTYTHHKTAQECKNNILENDPAYMSFFIQRIGSNLWNIEFPMTHGSAVLRKRGPIKFRKIATASEHDAAVKLVAWFTKNSEAIRSVTVQTYG